MSSKYPRVSRVKRFAPQDTSVRNIKRKLNGLSKAEQSLVSAELALANTMDWSGGWNPPISSGAPSGLYNLSTNSKEYKFVDYSIGTSGSTPTLASLGTVAVAPMVQLLNGLKLGTAAYQRIGNKIAMKSLYWSMNFGLKAIDNDPTTDLENYNVPVRFMIVYDKQPNGAAFTFADLLSAFSGVDNATARAIDTNSPNNLNNRDRFIVVADKRFILQSGGPSARQIKKFKRLSTSVSYKSGATVGDITDITSGSLYALAFRDSDMTGGATETTYNVHYSGDIRLRYQDD